MRTSDCMSTELFVVTPGEPVSRAAEIMRDLDVGIVPVVDNRSDMRLVGVITDRDVTVRCVAAGGDPSRVVRDYMTASGLTTATPNADVHDVLRRMGQAQVRRVPVVDSTDRLVGLVSTADLLIRLGAKEPLHIERTLEQISAPAFALL